MQVQLKHVPSDSDGSRSKNGKVRGNRTLANHTPSQMLDQKFSNKVTRGKEKVVDQVMKRLENLHLYSVQVDDEPKGELARFTLI